MIQGFNNRVSVHGFRVQRFSVLWLFTSLEIVVSLGGYEQRMQAEIKPISGNHGNGFELNL